MSARQPSYSYPEGTVTVACGQNGDKEYSSYNRSRSRCLGVARIILGCSAVAAQIAAIVVNSMTNNIWSIYVSAGTWAGALIITAGSFGLAANNKPTRARIIAHMVLSMASAEIATIFLLVFSSVSIATPYQYSIDSMTAVLYCLNGLLVVIAIATIPLDVMAAVTCGRTLFRKDDATDDTKPRVTGYNTRVSMSLGMARVTLGSTAVFLQIGAIVMCSQDTHLYYIRYSYYHYDAGWNYIGVGIWAGAMIIVAGSFGLLAWRKPSKCPIISHMVLSIVSAGVGALLILVFSSLGISDHSDIDYSKCPQCAATIAFNSALIAIAIATATMDIVAAALCCRAVCCCQPSQGDTLLPVSNVSSGLGVLTTDAEKTSDQLKLTDHQY